MSDIEITYYEPTYGMRTIKATEEELQAMCNSLDCRGCMYTVKRPQPPRDIYSEGSSYRIPQEYDEDL